MKPSEYDLRISKSIKAFRELMNVKQLAVANAIGCSQAMYCKMEKGHVSFTIGQIKKIAKEIGVSYLLVLGIADADESIEFSSTPLAEIFIKYAEKSKVENGDVIFDERKIQLIITHVKSNYERTLDNFHEKL